MILKPPEFIRPIAGHPLFRNCAGLWPFNEGSGNKVFDLSLYGNTGTFVNTPVWGSGYYGSDIDFVPGDSDYISTPYYPDLRKPITLIYWGTFGDISRVSGDLLGCHDGTNRFYLGIDNDGDYFCALGDSYIGFGIGDVAHNLSNGEFVMLAITGDGTTARVYKNGIEKTNFAYTASAACTLPFWIGARNHATNVPYHDGLIELVDIHERSLSASEIALLYLNPFCMFERDM